MNFTGKKIALKRTWTLESEIGEGGVGVIYTARDEHGTRAAVKLILKLSRNARELSFETLPSRPNILPIWDTGEWEGNYVLVMPLAEKSLRQHLDEANGALPLEEKLVILVDVAEALAGLEGEVVHRDLKPENILRHEGRWCLADFGIARYAQAITATATQKELFTSAYAAPEQWRHEHATPATDVYAFGITAFEVLQGYRPFSGPDLRDQHLHQDPPRLRGVGPSLEELITECLTKAPQARPTPANILLRLRRSQQPLSPAAAALQAANQHIVAQQVQAATILSVQQSKEDQRRELFSAAQQSLARIVEALTARIQDAASAAIITRLPISPDRPKMPMRDVALGRLADEYPLTITLGKGKLLVGSVKLAPPDCLAVSDYPAPFDVVAFSSIEVRQPPNRFQYKGRSHSLWFSDAHEEGIYRWFETAFMIMPLIAEISETDPFALDPTKDEAREAFSPMLAERQVAWEPVPFNQGDEEQFLERWIQWLAGAATGGLQHPHSMPEQSGGRYRRRG